MSLKACAALTLCLAGCTSGLTERIQTLEERSKQHEAELADHFRRVGTMGTELTGLRTALLNYSSFASCKDGNVRQLMEACRSTTGCSTGKIEAVMPAMMKQPNRMAFLDPTKGLEAMARKRLGDIATMIKQHPIVPSTTLLLISMPSGGFTDVDAAKTMALQVRKKLIDANPALQRVNTPEPHAIGCTELNRRLPQVFARGNPTNIPYAGVEPPSNRPHVVVWIFLVDC